MGCGEVPAAVVALELSGTISSAVVGFFRFGSGGGVAGKGFVSGGAGAEFFAEEADAGFFFGRGGTDEGELREGLDVHEVVCFSL